MNIIYVKQSTKAKVNKRETETAIKGLLQEKFGELECATYATADIDGVTAGASVMLAYSKKNNKLFAVSIGASTKDNMCVTDTNSVCNYSFEYIMEVDKKIVKDIDIKDVLTSGTSNKDLMEMMRAIGSLASNGRYQGLLSGSFGDVEAHVKDNRYGGVVLVDFKLDGEDVETEVIGRRGKLHLLQAVPLLKNEIAVMNFIDDRVMAELIALRMISEKTGAFSNRLKKFNFADILPVDTLDEKTIDAINVKKDKDGKMLLYTVKDVEAYLDKAF